MNFYEFLVEIRTCDILQGRLLKQGRLSLAPSGPPCLGALANRSQPEESNITRDDTAMTRVIEKFVQLCSAHSCQIYVKRFEKYIICMIMITCSSRQQTRLVWKCLSSFNSLEAEIPWGQSGLVSLVAAEGMRESGPYTWGLLAEGWYEPSQWNQWTERASVPWWCRIMADMIWPVRWTRDFGSVHFGSILFPLHLQGKHVCFLVFCWNLRPRDTAGNQDRVGWEKPTGPQHVDHVLLGSKNLLYLVISSPCIPDYSYVFILDHIGSYWHYWFIVILQHPEERPSVPRPSVPPGPTGVPTGSACNGTTPPAKPQARPTDGRRL